MEDQGDVAFVKHTTVLDYASDGNLDSVLRAWATRPMSDFKLLCRDGGCADVDEYESCNLALVPSRAVVGAPALGEDGSLASVGRAIQEGLDAATSNSDFFDRGRGLINNFPFSVTAESLTIVEGGYEGYITPEANTALNTFTDLIDGARRSSNRNSATFCSYTPEQQAACEQVRLCISLSVSLSFCTECRGDLQGVEARI